MRENGKQREKSEAFYELTSHHDPTYLQRSLLKFTKCWWKWISCESSWRAEFWEGINERGTKTASPKIWAKGRDGHEIRSHWELTETLIRTLYFTDLRNWGIELSERKGGSPAESELILKENFLWKVEDCLTRIVKPDSSCQKEG